MKYFIINIILLASCTIENNIEQTYPDECLSISLRWQRPPEYPMPVYSYDENILDLLYEVEEIFDGYVVVSETEITTFGQIIEFSLTENLPDNANSLTISFDTPYLSYTFLNKDLSEDSLFDYIILNVGFSLGIVGAQTCNLKNASILLSQRAELPQFISELY